MRWIFLLILPQYTWAYLVCYGYYGFVDDLGWTFSHNLARAWTDAKLGTASKHVEGIGLILNVTERRVALQSFVDDGCDLIVTGSDVLSDVTKEFATKYPATKFVCLTGKEIADNLTAANVRIYQASYLVGAIAALQKRMDKHGKKVPVRALGYVGAMYSPGSIRNLNAFYLGAKSVDFEGPVYALYTGSWFDPRAEQIAGLRLMHWHDVDVIAYDSDSTALSKLAKENGRFSITFKADGTAMFGESNLASAIFVWNEIFVSLARTAMSAQTEWLASKDANFFVGYERNAVSLGTLSIDVEAATRLHVEREIGQLRAGNDTIFCPRGDAFISYCPDGANEITNSAGAFTVPATWIYPCNATLKSHSPPVGQSCLSDAQMLSMAYFFDGIEDLGLQKIPSECPAGTKKDALAPELCVKCLAGTYNNIAELTECLICPPGKATHQHNAVSCIDCEMGFYRAGHMSSTECAKCPAGSYTERHGSIACSECREGTFNNQIKGNCEKCGVGTFANVSGLSRCLLCPVGFSTQGNQGQIKCTGCSPGKYSKNIGSSECSLCSQGNYTDGVAQSFCKSCLPMQTTQLLGSSGVHKCKCESSLYWEPSSNRCEPCPSYMVCGLGTNISEYWRWNAKGRPNDGSQEMLFPMLESSYTSFVDDPLKVFYCSSAARCPGGPPGTCGANLKVDIGSCAHCEESWYWDGERCTKCTAIKSSLLPPIAFVIFVPIAISLFYRFFRDDYDKWNSVRTGYASLAFVIFNHCQLLALGRSANIRLPPKVDTWFSVWTFTENMFSIFQAECVFNTHGSVFMLVLRTSSILMLAGQFLIVYMCSHLVSRAIAKPHCAMSKDRTLNLFFSVVFTFFAGVCAICMGVFKCHENPNGLRTLSQDESIICGSDEWKGMVIIAALSCVVYLLSFSALIAYVIVTAPRNFVNKSFQRRWKFLLIKYRPSVWWWAIVFCLKGILMNLGYIFLLAGTYQILWLGMICFAYITALIVFNPWRHRAANFMDIYSHLSLSYVFAVLVWFSHDGTHDDDASIQEHAGTLVIGISSLSLFVVGILSVYITVSNRSFRDPSKCATSLMTLSTLTLEQFGVVYKRLSEWDQYFLIQALTAISVEFGETLEGEPIGQNCASLRISDGSLTLKSLRLIGSGMSIGEVALQTCSTMLPESSERDLRPALSELQSHAISELGNLFKPETTALAVTMEPLFTTPKFTQHEEAAIEETTVEATIRPGRPPLLRL